MSSEILIGDAKVAVNNVCNITVRRAVDNTEITGNTGIVGCSLKPGDILDIASHEDRLLAVTSKICEACLYRGDCSLGVLPTMLIQYLNTH